MPHTTYQLFINAIRTVIAPDDYVLANRPLTDAQRRAIFAKSAAGSRATFNPPPSAKKPELWTGGNPSFDERTGTMRPPSVHTKPSVSGKPGQIWPGGTPPWIYDEKIGGPNPHYPHPDNPNMRSPGLGGPDWRHSPATVRKPELTRKPYPDSHPVNNPPAPPQISTATIMPKRGPSNTIPAGHSRIVTKNKSVVDVPSQMTKSELSRFMVQFKPGSEEFKAVLDAVGTRIKIKPDATGR
jgi:hypothetical protein